MIKYFFTIIMEKYYFLRSFLKTSSLVVVLLQLACTQQSSYQFKSEITYDTLGLNFQLQQLYPSVFKDTTFHYYLKYNNDDSYDYQTIYNTKLTVSNFSITNVYFPSNIVYVANHAIPSFSSGYSKFNEEFSEFMQEMYTLRPFESITFYTYIWKGGMIRQDGNLDLRMHIHCTFDALTNMKKFTDNSKKYIIINIPFIVKDSLILPLSASGFLNDNSLYN